MKRTSKRHLVNPERIHSLNEMEGFRRLGMKRETHRIARHLLKDKIVTAGVFSIVIDTIQSTADRLKHWKPLIETAYNRLSKTDQRRAGETMLALYVSLKDWNSAWYFIPKRPSNEQALLFMMWTSLNLKKMDAAKSVFSKCQRALKPENDQLANAMLLAAMGAYCAQAGELDAAEKYWAASAVHEPFIFGSLEELAKIQAGRGLHQIKAARMQIEVFKKTGTDAIVLPLPGTTKSMVKATERKLASYEKILKKILPKDELWRFGSEGFRA